MIKYDNLWKYLKDHNISQYRLKVSGIGISTIYRLKRNQPVSTETLDKICTILDCRIEDVVTYVREN